MVRSLHNEYDVIILDLMLPVVDGLTLLREIRTSESNGILIMTAKRAVHERVVGLNAGADDQPLCV